MMDQDKLGKKHLISYTLEDVSRHDKRDDAWVVLNGWVLDITYFFQLHPGGEEIMLNYIGKDVSKVFKDPQVHFHSIAAYNLLKKFRIGYITDFLKEEDVIAAQEETKLPEDYGIDLNKGLVWQTSLLGDKYVEFIEKTFIVSEQVSLRYFDNNIMEFLSRSPWYTVPIVWIPMIILIFSLSIKFGVNLMFLPVYIFGGIITWMFIEYMLHRHIFHMKTSTFRWNVFHFCLHGYHHIVPMDPNRLTFPPVPAMLIGIIVYNILSIIFRFEVTLAVLCGIIIGYVLYDLEHYALHHNAFLNVIPYFKNMKKHHLYHHYKNEDSNFGISSMLFDYVFQSFDSIYLKSIK